MEILDARGLECPLPVVKTKELLKEIDKHAIIKDVKLQHETLQRRDGVEVDAVLVAMTVTFDK